MRCHRRPCSILDFVICHLCIMILCAQLTKIANKPKSSLPADQTCKCGKLSIVSLFPVARFTHPLSNRRPHRSHTNEATWPADQCSGIFPGGLARPRAVSPLWPGLSRLSILPTPRAFCCDIRRCKCSEVLPVPSIWPRMDRSDGRSDAKKAAGNGVF
jgi:hypothetical protein